MGIHFLLVQSCVPTPSVYVFLTVLILQDLVVRQVDLNATAKARLDEDKVYDISQFSLPGLAPAHVHSHYPLHWVWCMEELHMYLPQLSLVHSMSPLLQLITFHIW